MSKSSGSVNFVDMDHFDELVKVTRLTGWCWGDLQLVSESFLNTTARRGGVLKRNVGFHPSENAGCKTARKSVDAGCNLLPVVMGSQKQQAMEASSNLVIKTRLKGDL